MKLLFIVNERSGNGNGAKIWGKLEKELSIQYDVFITKHEKQAIEFAEKLHASIKEPTLLVGIGGDGTFHEILNGIIGNEHIIVGAVCAGSGNDFKRAYNQFNDAKEIEAYIQQAQPSNRQIDLGVIHAASSQIQFVNNSGVGFDATVAITANESKGKKLFNKLKLGKLSYVFYLLKCLFTFKPFTLKVMYDGEEKTFDNVWFVTASNQPYFGGGMKISPASNTEDGLLELTIVHNLNKYKLLFVFGTVFLGKHTMFKEIVQLQSEQFIIHMNQNYLMHADGEKLAINTSEQPITFSINEEKWNLANPSFEQKQKS